MRAVVAELGDHEVGPRPGLQLELEVLEDHLGLEALEGRDGGPDEEARGVLGAVGAGLVRRGRGRARSGRPNRGRRPAGRGRRSPRPGGRPETARTLRIPRASSSQASERRALRLRSRQATWTMTSWPRARSSSARGTGLAMAWPPALSVIEMAAIRGSSTRARAASRLRRAGGSRASPRAGTISVTVTNSSVASRRWRRVGLAAMVMRADASTTDGSGSNRRPSTNRSKKSGSASSSTCSMRPTNASRRARARRERRRAAAPRTDALPCWTTRSAGTGGRNPIRWALGTSRCEANPPARWSAARSPGRQPEAAQEDAHPDGVGRLRLGQLGRVAARERDPAARGRGRPPSCRP